MTTNCLMPEATDEQIARWLDQLDAIDPYFGDETALLGLVVTAPDITRRRNLLRQIADNRQFRAAVFHSTDNQGFSPCKTLNSI